MSSADCAGRGVVRTHVVVDCGRILIAIILILYCLHEAFTQKQFFYSKIW